MLEIVLATNNRKKGIELMELLMPYAIGVKTLADFDRKLDVVEDGDTFLKNAQKKAVEQALFLGAWTIGEDSGLSVDALDGAPGVYSARFAAGQKNRNASDEENNRFLLEKLAKVPLQDRTAHYTCAAVISDPWGNIRGWNEQYCCGRILMEPSGASGFGYDPLFEIVEYHQTFGQLSPVVKRAISHRARALRQLIRDGMFLERCGPNDSRDN